MKEVLTSVLKIKVNIIADYGLFIKLKDCFLSKQYQEDFINISTYPDTEGDIVVTHLLQHAPTIDNMQVANNKVYVKNTKDIYKAIELYIDCCKTSNL